MFKSVVKFPKGRGHSYLCLALPLLGLASVRSTLVLYADLDSNTPGEVLITEFRWGWCWVS